MPAPSKMDKSDNFIWKIKPRIHPNGHEENEIVQEVAMGLQICPIPESVSKEWT